MKGANKVDTRRQSLKMFSSKEATDEMKAAKAEMSVSTVNESREEDPRQLLHGDLNATFTTPRTHPPAYKKPGPRIIPPFCSPEVTDTVLSLTYNEAEIFRRRKTNPVCSFPDKEAVCCSRTDTVYGFTYKETQDFRITRELSPVPNSRTDPVLSSTVNKNATDDCCARTDPTQPTVSSFFRK